MELVGAGRHVPGPCGRDVLGVCEEQQEGWGQGVRVAGMRVGKWSGCKSGPRLSLSTDGPLGGVTRSGHSLNLSACFLLFYFERKVPK